MVNGPVPPVGPGGPPPAGPPPWPGNPPAAGPPPGNPPAAGPPPWPANTPGYPPQHYPQHPHGQQPPWPTLGAPPTPPGGTRNWLLIGLALLAVIGLTIGATLAFTHRGVSSENGGGSSAATGEIASANDTGPVAIITEEPTCGRWTEIDGQLASQVNNGQPDTDWGKRDASIPATAWTPQQRQMYEATAAVFTAEADKLIALARDTPHRVVREIYSQIIAYRRAYAAAIPTYTPSDDMLAITGNALGAVINAVCATANNYTAAKRAPAITAAAPPTALAPIGDIAEPQRFITTPSDTCSQVLSQLDRLDTKLSAWYKVDANLPASQRSSADTVLWDMAGKVLDGAADEREQFGRSSGNPVTEDFLVMSAQYYRAFAAAIPTYVKEDIRIYDAGRYLGISVRAACQSVQG